MMRPRPLVSTVVCCALLGVLTVAGCQNASDQTAAKPSTTQDPPQVQALRAQQAQGAAADAQRAAAAMAGQPKK